MKSSVQIKVFTFAAATGMAEPASELSTHRRRGNSRRRGSAHSEHPAADSLCIFPISTTPPETRELRLARILADGFWRHDGSPNG